MIQILSSLFSEDTKEKKIRKVFFVVIMPKRQVGSFLFILIITGLLNLLFPYFFIFFDLLFVWNPTLLLIFLLVIGIILLRPYESIKP